MTNKFIWDTKKLKKIKTKEIREFVIRQRGSSVCVEAFGYFGGGVEIFTGESLEEAQRFIDGMTEEKGKE